MYDYQYQEFNIFSDFSDMITVILTKDVADCGHEGDVVTVSRGYARNFLLRTGVAVAATEEQIAEFKLRDSKKKKAADEKKSQSERAARLLDGKTITISAKSDHGTLFAAVDEDAVAAALTELIDESVAVSVVRITTPIKKIGNHSIDLDYGDGQVAHVTVSVVEA